MPISFLSTFVILALVLVVCLWSLSLGKLWYLCSLLVLPVVVFFVAKPSRIFVLAVILSFSTLRLPFFPKSMTLFQAVQVVFSCFLIFYIIMNKRAGHAHSGMRTCVMMFTAVIIITMVFRGAGIRALGSSQWGGGGYVALLICLSFLLMIDVVTLTPGEWKMAMIGMCLFSLFPAIGEMIYFVSKGAVQIQYSFLQAPLFTVSSLNAIESESGVVRYGTGFANIFLLIPFIFMVRPFHGHKAILSLFVIVGSMILAMFSGSRTSIIENLMFLGLWFSVSEGTILWRRVFLFGVISLAVLIIMALGAKFLPLSLQRVLTIIPFADLSWEVRHDAMGTWDWRIEVWSRAMEDIPNYLFLGQGIAFDPRELYSNIAAGTFIREWAFITHSYHQGVLSLILIFGIPGLVLGVALLFLGLLRHIRLFRQLEWRDSFIRRIYVVILYLYGVQVVKYLIIYGDVHVSFPHILFLLAILEVLVRSNESMLVEDDRHVSKVVGSL